MAAKLMRKRKTKNDDAEIITKSTAADSRNKETPHFIHSLNDTSSKISQKYSLWFFALFTPYVVGFILITMLCLSLVDISLDTYFHVLLDSFSLIGLWSIGYFLISILVLLYGFYFYLTHR